MSFSRSFDKVERKDTSLYSVGLLREDRSWEWELLQSACRRWGRGWRIWRLNKMNREVAIDEEMAWEGCDSVLAGGSAV